MVIDGGVSGSTAVHSEPVTAGVHLTFTSRWDFTQTSKCTNDTTLKQSVKLISRYRPIDPLHRLKQLCDIAVGFILKAVTAGKVYAWVAVTAGNTVTLLSFILQELINNKMIPRCRPHQSHMLSKWYPEVAQMTPRCRPNDTHMYVPYIYMHVWLLQPVSVCFVFRLFFFHMHVQDIFVITPPLRYFEQ